MKNLRLFSFSVYFHICCFTIGVCAFTYDTFVLVLSDRNWKTKRTDDVRFCARILYPIAQTILQNRLMATKQNKTNREHTHTLTHKILKTDGLVQHDNVDPRTLSVS